MFKSKIRLLAACVVIFVAGAGPSAALVDNGLARTPPMGWNSWNKFGCNVSEQLIKEIADAIAASGMKKAGYQYVNTDDCWQDGRDAKGTMIAFTSRLTCQQSSMFTY